MAIQCKLSHCKLSSKGCDTVQALVAAKGDVKATTEADHAAEENLQPVSTTAAPAAKTSSAEVRPHRCFLVHDRGPCSRDLRVSLCNMLGQ
jgi:hypothetical protein